MAGRPEADNDAAFGLALVAMPWPLYQRSSVQLGALKAYCNQEDPTLQVTALHPYLEVAQLLGPATYQRLSQNLWLCEALYAPLNFPETTETSRRLFHRLVGRRPAIDFDRTVALLREQLVGWVGRQPWHTFELVGFSVCFHQLFASLAAAQAIKKVRPELAVVFGGSSCAGAAGESLLQVFPAIDYVVGGEGEQPLLALCHHLAGRRPFPAEQVMGRAAGQVTRSAKDVQLADLGCLPVPDYEEYFVEVARAFGSGLPFVPELPVEFSRGCWWNRCAFCNLNLQWCGYRAKSAERMAREVENLAVRHAVADFAFTDNVLPPKESRRFFEQLAASGRDYRFFAELRASQQGDLAAMARGGLKVVQAGIEALSDGLLARMRKGATVMENVALMKECARLGILLQGNLIVEFPGSTEAEVEETLITLDFLWPFAPLTTAAFFLGHGSPMAAAPRQYGLRAITAHSHYRQLVPPGVLAQLTLLIGDYSGDRIRQRRQWAPVVAKVKAWQRFHAARRDCFPLLCYRDAGSFLLIRQETPEGTVLHHRLKGTSRAIYLACHEPVDAKALLERFPRVTEKNLRAFLDDLGGKRLLFRHGDRYLSLAVRAGNER